MICVVDFDFDVEVVDVVDVFVVVVVAAWNGSVDCILSVLLGAVALYFVACPPSEVACPPSVGAHLWERFLWVMVPFLEAVRFL